MSEPANKKRKFWQIHLSTAVLMMLLSGAMLYQATQIRRYPKGMSWDIGWPFDAVEAVPKYNEEGDDVEWDDSSPYLIKFRYVADWKYLILDVVVDVGLVLLLAFVCEWLIRRRFQFSLRMAVYLIVIAAIIIGCFDAHYEATHIPPYPTFEKYRAHVMAYIFNGSGLPLEVELSSEGGNTALVYPKGLVCLEAPLDARHITLRYRGGYSNNAKLNGDRYLMSRNEGQNIDLKGLLPRRVFYFCISPSGTVEPVVEDEFRHQAGIAPTAVIPRWQNDPRKRN